MALTFTKFYVFTEDLAEKVHNLGSDTLKVLLTNTAPDATTDDEKADISGELSTAYGYTSGGATLTVTTSAQTTGTYYLIANDVTWTASGGSIGPFRYCVLYNDTATNDELIGYWDIGYSVTVTDGNTFTIDLDQTLGIFYFG